MERINENGGRRTRDSYHIVIAAASRAHVARYSVVCRNRFSCPARSSGPRVFVAGEKKLHAVDSNDLDSRLSKNVPARVTHAWNSDISFPKIRILQTSDILP